MKGARRGAGARGRGEGRCRRAVGAECRWDRRCRVLESSRTGKCQRYRQYREEERPVRTFPCGGNR